MRQGELSLKIESFALQPLFDIVGKSKTGYTAKGVELCIEPTSHIVKADKALTLFMINTIADNARKNTPSGGKVMIASRDIDDAVEISVSDNGTGIAPEKLPHLFDNKPVHDDTTTEEQSHGFGLVNCKGIIEKYKKTSQLFSKCNITAQSQPGKGTTISFRLPKGILRGIIIALIMSSTAIAQDQTLFFTNTDDHLGMANSYADSAYFANIAGQYQKTLAFADTCIYHLNQHYLQLHPNSVDTMLFYSEINRQPAETRWYSDSIRTNYNIILDIRNEAAVASLALHKWDLYHYNNRVYTQLFRQNSADNNLGNYVTLMQRSATNKNVAIALLVISLLFILLAYYMLYYRNLIKRKRLVDNVLQINETLLSDTPVETKLNRIDEIWNNKDTSYIQHSTKPSDNETFNDIVGQIREALLQSVAMRQSQFSNIELAQDELNRRSYENARLHVSNSVLDNCLSTLKHETMYYPSRIEQLATASEPPLEALSETAHYYRDLYQLLSLQALRQTDIPLRPDEDMLDYLLEIMIKENSGEKPEVDVSKEDNAYFTLSVTLNRLQLTDEQIAKLFTPLTHDVQFIIARQIVREIGEATDARGCGIQARKSKYLTIEITLTRKIWKTLKSSSWKTYLSN